MKQTSKRYYISELRTNNTNIIVQPTDKREEQQSPASTKVKTLFVSASVPHTDFSIDR